MAYTGETDFDIAVVRAKREINYDIAHGIVPPTVTTFAELHDHVDANGYGGAFEAWDEGCTSDEAFVNLWNRVQNTINEWLAAGRP